MKKIHLFFLIGTIISLSQNVTLSGYLEDGKSGESLIGANILISELNIGCSTNNYGFFSLTIPKGEYTLEILSNGYGNNSYKIPNIEITKSFYKLSFAFLAHSS